MTSREEGRVSRAAAIHDHGAKFICGSALLGVPSEERILGRVEGAAVPTEVGRDCLIMAGATIYEGVRLGSDAVVEDGVRIGSGSIIGDSTRLVHRACVCDGVHIGSHCRIAGFVCDSTTIEDHCTVMGTLVHRYDKPDHGWWEIDEPAPTVRHHSVVGMGAHVVGDVEIGPHAYVVAGATITRSVPPHRVALSNSKMIAFEDWTGPGLTALYERWSGGWSRDV